MRADSDDIAQVVELGGDRFMLRPMRPEDRRAYADFIARVEARDLRRRFFDPGGASPETDFERHGPTGHGDGIRFVAVREASGSADELVGEARVYRYPGTSAAELAI